MSNYEDSDSEVDRIMDRPPSSYGSMHSDDHDEDDEDIEDLKPPPTRLRLQRSDSPETAITQRTNTHLSSVYQGGLILRPSSSTYHEEAAYHPRHGEPSTVEYSDVGTERGMDIRTERGTDAVTERGMDEEMEDLPEPQNGGAPMEVPEQPTEAQTEATEEDDYDEFIEDFVEPLGYPPTPPEGAGLHFQHTHKVLTLRYVLKSMVKRLQQLHPSDIDFYKRCLSYDGNFKKRYSTVEDLHDPLDIADKMIEVCGLGEALFLTIRNLQNIRRDDLASTLRKSCRRALFQYDLKNAHERHYYCLYEGRCRPGQQRYISDVYVEPVTVIKGTRDPINYENEVQRVPYTIEETVIRAPDIFRPLPNDPKPIRTVLMTGVPGCGLSVAVSKFIIDWTEDKNNQDIQFVFPLPTKQLRFGNKKIKSSLLEVISYFYADAKDIKFIEKPDCLSLFVIDALELCPHPLDFKNNPAITSAREEVEFDIILTSLIKGTLLPHAKVWITSHVPDTYRIPADLIDRRVELRGFTDEKKEEYFTKRTTDPELGRKVYNHLKRSKALEIFCHLPLVSWMVAYIFELGFRDHDYGQHPPGITAFYSPFIIVQMNRTFEKYRGYNGETWTDQDKDFIWKMGKMAFKMLQDGRESFTVDDLASVKLTYEDLKCRDELTIEVKRTSEDLRTWVFKFIHLTLQEYMAAMYAYAAYRMKGKNVIDSINMSWLPGSKDRSVIDLFRPAIDRAVAHPHGHWDMFLRFLVGLLTPGTENNLHGYLLNHRHPKAKGTEDVVKHINKRMKDNIHPDRRLNLELCLVELEEGKKEPRR